MSLATGTRPERVLSPEEFGWIRSFLHARTGIELRDGKELMVASRLDGRLRERGLDSYGEYFRLIEAGDDAESRRAVDLLTTNQTSFFREPSHFEFLRDVLADRSWRSSPVRIWSAACATGQEAYSVAMVLAQNLPAEQRWEVLGTDICGPALTTARRGVYPVGAAEQIPAPLLRQFCLRGRAEYDGCLAIAGGLRSRVDFREVNLIDLPDDLGSFDVIFLRNVMIYFGEQTRHELVRQISRSIRPGGYLIVGHAESLGSLRTGLRVIRPSIYQVGTGDE